MYFHNVTRKKVIFTTLYVRNINFHNITHKKCSLHHVTFKKYNFHSIARKNNFPNITSKAYFLNVTLQNINFHNIKHRKNSLGWMAKWTCSYVFRENASLPSQSLKWATYIHLPLMKFHFLKKCKIKLIYF